MKVLFLLLVASSAVFASPLRIFKVVEEGTKDSSSKLITRGDTKEKITILKRSIVHHTDVVEIYSTTTGSTTFNGVTEPSWGIVMKFSDDGLKKLRSEVNFKDRDQIAIMIDGDIISAPIIMGEVSSNMAFTFGSKKECDALVKRIDTLIKEYEKGK